MARTARSNWADSYRYTAPDVVTPASVDDLVSIVGRDRSPIHALGTRHSFTDLPDTGGTLLDLAQLPIDVRVADDRRTATVSGWARYGVIAQALEAEGLALHNLGSLPHISVAGATATGTHGSGDRNGMLGTAVAGLTWVDADGEVRSARRGGEDFASRVVHLGAAGIVLDVTLDVQPSYRMRQDIYEGLSWAALLEHLDAVTSAGYSTSVFTNWGDDAGFVWVKTRLDGDDLEPAPTVLDATRTADDSPLGSGDNITELRRPGPWMLRLPHFRLDREPSFGAELQSEYFVDRADAPTAIAAVRELAPVVVPHLVVSELRTMSRDELWLSPARDRDAVAIHFTWYDRPDEVARALVEVEAALAPFAARPHWGKVHLFDAEGMAAVHPDLARARAVFDRDDPEGRFVNGHLVRVGARTAPER